MEKSDLYIEVFLAAGFEGPKVVRKIVEKWEQ